MRIVHLFDLPFWSGSMQSAIDEVLRFVDAGGRGVVVTPNVDHVMFLEKDLALKLQFQSAALVLPDGMPIVWASKVLAAEPLEERLTGADLFLPLATAAVRRGDKIAVIGGSTPEVLARLRRMLDGNQLVGVHFPPFGFEQNDAETQRLEKFLQSWKPKIVFIGVGAPKQERWAFRTLERQDWGPTVIACVGAALDMAAGMQKRAPRFMQRLGFEWAWRLAAEPRRLAPRYFRNLGFFKLVLKERRRLKRKT